jgi:hypothetical protein
MGITGFAWRSSKIGTGRSHNKRVLDLPGLPRE